MKSLIMVLGNSKDLDRLLQLLQKETNEELIQHIITVLGAMGRKEAIEPLTAITLSTKNKEIRNRAKEAILLIQSLNKY